MAGGGLRRLAAAVLGVHLDKGAAVRCSHMAILTTVAGYGTYGCRACYLRLQVRCSDWEAAALTAEQARCI